MATIGIGISVEYTGGSKIAVGSTQIELKSLVAPLTAYIIRGVEAMEIIPQQTSSRNSTTSPTRQSVRAAATPMTTNASAMTAATYQRSSGGSATMPSPVQPSVA